MKKLKLILAQRWRRKAAGFTLMELLAVIVMSSFIGAGLMVFMSGLWRADEKETILTQTDQEMQTALDYLSRDLKEAIYVYDTTTGAQKDKVFDAIPDLGTNTTPVLAFWKVEPISEAQLPSNCNSFSDDAKKSECAVLKQKRLAYTLVVYYQTKEPDSKWKGESRIIRYSLPKYTNVANLTQTTGFVDPAEFNNFSKWPQYQGSGALPTFAATLSDLPVLVDFVDAPNSTGITNMPTCATGYNRLPSNATEYNSFFICVRQKGDDDVVNKQDILIYLRGNPKNRGILKTDVITALPTQETRITLRGILDKTE